MLREILEELNQSVVEGRDLDVKTFRKLLNKYGYTEDPEEISFALECADIATVTDLSKMVDILNNQGYTTKSVEKMLKDALN